MRIHDDDDDDQNNNEQTISISINLLVVYRESVNLIGYITIC